MKQRVQFVLVTEKGWIGVLAPFLALAGLSGLYFWRVQVRRPPTPAAASLPASARLLLLPYRKDEFRLTVQAHGELDYRVGMQSGATLVYAWSTRPGGDTVTWEFPGRETTRAAEAHGAFEAQSSGWYRWHWKNPNGKPITLNIKLHGYYEPASIH